MPRLGELSAEKGADTDQRVLEAYQMQCVAEAQEGQSRIIHVADPNHNDLLNLLTSNHQLTAWLYDNRACTGIPQVFFLYCAYMCM